MDTIELALKIITTIVAVTGGLVAIINLMQKWANDRRTASWARLQWALDKTTSDNDQEQMLGWLMLDIIVKDNVKDRRDRAVADSLIAYIDNIDVHYDVHFNIPQPDDNTPRKASSSTPTP